MTGWTIAPAVGMPHSLAPEFSRTDAGRLQAAACARGATERAGFLHVAVRIEDEWEPADEAVDEAPAALPPRLSRGRGKRVRASSLPSVPNPRWGVWGLEGDPGRRVQPFPRADAQVGG